MDNIPKESKISQISQLRRCLDEFLQNHIEANGIGADPYWQTQMSHPMADAKFCMAVAQSYCAELIGFSKATGYIKPTLKRLNKSAIQISENIGSAVGWGLGFPWEKHDYKSTDPLLITSVIVTRSLQTLVEMELLPVEFKALYEAAERGISWWAKDATKTPPNGPALPIYGLSSFREPVHNTAAYCLNVLLKSNCVNQKENFKKLDYLANQFIYGAGWKYSHENPVIDLLHQWYIINSLVDQLGTERFRTQALTIIGQFGTSNGFLDVAELKPKHWQPLSKTDLGFVLIRSIDTGILAIKPKPARLWSIGEMLLGLSKFCQNHPNEPLWSRYAYHLVERILCKEAKLLFTEWDFPRHQMHLAHGISAFLAYRRQKRIL